MPATQAQRGGGIGIRPRPDVRELWVDLEAEPPSSRAVAADIFAGTQLESP